MWEFMSQLCSEPSLYDAYILPNTYDASWVLMLVCLAGLALAMLSKMPEKRGN